MKILRWLYNGLAIVGALAITVLVVAILIDLVNG
jgi:hypothetical protein